MLYFLLAAFWLGTARRLSVLLRFGILPFLLLLFLLFPFLDGLRLVLFCFWIADCVGNLFEALVVFLGGVYAEHGIEVDLATVALRLHHEVELPAELLNPSQILNRQERDDVSAPEAFLLQQILRILLLLTCQFLIVVEMILSFVF